MNTSDSQTKYNTTIAIDFDGTISSYHDGWLGHEKIGENDVPLPGAFDFIRRMVRDHIVLIWSVRGNTPGGQIAMRQWFIKHGLEPSVVSLLQFPPGKIAAAVYIDDRGHRFLGKWDHASEKLDFFGTNPWYYTAPGYDNRKP